MWRMSKEFLEASLFQYAFTNMKLIHFILDWMLWNDTKVTKETNKAVLETKKKQKKCTKSIPFIINLVAFAPPLYLSIFIKITYSHKSPSSLYSPLYNFLLFYNNLLFNNAINIDYFWTIAIIYIKSMKLMFLHIFLLINIERQGWANEFNRQGF